MIYLNATIGPFGSTYGCARSKSLRMTATVDTAAGETRGHYRLSGSPTLGLTMGTWGFFVGFAAVALYGLAAKYFQEQMNLRGLGLGLLVAAPHETDALA